MSRQPAAVAVEVRGMPAIGRCRVMGVVNVTPDSFSDGGIAWPEAADAIRHGLGLLDDGADLIDVGGESTRPGAVRVDAAEEWRRIGPVVRELSAAGAVVSVDTMRASTAERALAAGAALVNDVSGGLADPDLPRFVGAAGVPYVVMHWRGHSADMQRRAVYGDVVGEVRAELRDRLDALTSAGVDPEQIVLDPGIGFAKLAEHNWALLAAVGELATLGRPLLVGASRKSFLGTLLGSPDRPRPHTQRDAATAAITAIVASRGVWGVRVHDVRSSVDAVRVVAALAAVEGDR
jgi:dihydropteroate synthase